MNLKLLDKMLRKKPLSEVQADASKTVLNKDLSAFDLLLLGLGGIIGSGIFVVTGFAAARYAGPAITISFVLGGLVCVVTAFAYSELACLIPTSGGAYTYAFVTMGEFVGFLLGWNIILTYTFGGATVASGWSGYVCSLLAQLGFDFPKVLMHGPLEGGVVNLPAILIVLLLMALSIRGTKLMAKFNGFLVFGKLAAIFAFVFLAIPHIDVSNWAVFAPKGWTGILTGAGFVFMSFNGFDTVATAAEECKNPQRDVPIGIIGSLVISTILYVIVSGILTAIAPYATLDNRQPIAESLLNQGIALGSKLVAAGAIAGLTTVILSNLFGQARILMMMGRDSLAPKWLQFVHPVYATPSRGIILSGSMVAFTAGLLPTDLLSQLVSLSALFMYVFVGLCVMLARKQYPTEPRAFQCPAVYVIASVAVLCCAFLFFQLLAGSALSFFGSLAVGVVLYFVMSLRYPKLQAPR